MWNSSESQGQETWIPIFHTHITHKKETNMAMKDTPFEDVFPIEHGDFLASHLLFQGV